MLKSEGTEEQFPPLFWTLEAAGTNEFAGKDIRLPWDSFSLSYMSGTPRQIAVWKRYLIIIKIS